MPQPEFSDLKRSSGERVLIGEAGIHDVGIINAGDHSFGEIRVLAI